MHQTNCFIDYQKWSVNRTTWICCTQIPWFSSWRAQFKTYQSHIKKALNTLYVMTNQLNSKARESDIAISFSKYAQGYDKHAILQSMMARRLALFLPDEIYNLVFLFIHFLIETEFFFSPSSVKFWSLPFVNPE